MKTQWGRSCSRLPGQLTLTHRRGNMHYIEPTHILLLILKRAFSDQSKASRQILETNSTSFCLGNLWTTYFLLQKFYLLWVLDCKKLASLIIFPWDLIGRNGPECPQTWGSQFPCPVRPANLPWGTSTCKEIPSQAHQSVTAINSPNVQNRSNKERKGPKSKEVLELGSFWGWDKVLFGQTGESTR